MSPRLLSASCGRVRRALLLTTLGILTVSTVDHPTAAAAQAVGAGPGRFLAVKAWRLTWNGQSTQASAIRNGPHSTSGTAVLTLDDETAGAGIVESEGMWSGTGDVNASGVFHEDRGTAGKHREGSGSTGARAELGVDVSQGTYSLHVYCDEPIVGNAYGWSVDS